MCTGVDGGDTGVSGDCNQVARGRKSRDRMSWEVSGSKRMIERFNTWFQLRRFISQYRGLYLLSMCPFQ